MLSYLEKALNTLIAIQHPGAKREFFTSKAFSVTCYQVNSAVKHYQSYFATIVDVGANIGQFAIWRRLSIFQTLESTLSNRCPTYSECCKKTLIKIRKFKSFQLCLLGNHQGTNPFPS